MLEKLKSRKLIAFGVTFVAIVVNDLLGKPLDAEALQNLIYAMVAYVGAQGAVDVAAIVKGGNGDA